VTRDVSDIKRRGRAALCPMVYSWMRIGYNNDASLFLLEMRIHKYCAMTGLQIWITRQSASASAE
jgi:hypothetical protein